MGAAVTTITVPSGNGFDFLVRLVKKGAWYGKDFSIEHRANQPLVEFYDTRFPLVRGLDGQVLGQFVSRYTRAALDGSSEWSSGRNLGQTGLQLGGRHVPEWKIDAPGMRRVLAWLKEQV